MTSAECSASLAATPPFLRFCFSASVPNSSVGSRLFCQGFLHALLYFSIILKGLRGRPLMICGWDRKISREKKFRGPCKNKKKSKGLPRDILRCERYVVKNLHDPPPIWGKKLPGIETIPGSFYEMPGGYCWYP